MRSFISFLLIFIFLGGTLSAQTKSVSGTVAGPDGTALQGISVQVEGSTVGTATNAAGKYELNVPAHSVLVFSGVGFAVQRVSVNDRSTINVTMQVSTTQLSAVVVTALGIKQEKKALGYAVQDVSGTDMTRTHPSNPLDALSGKVAGATIISSSGMPGGSVRVQLRGATSILGDNSPLFVIDGVPVDNSENSTGNDAGGTAGVGEANRLVDLNPDDIESISVLKGPAAAALYGSMASNGVVIITTKTGGAIGGKRFRISYGITTTFDRVNKLPERQDKYAQGFGGSILRPNSSSGLRSYSYGPALDTMVFDGNTNYLWDSHGMLVGKSSNPNGAPAIVYDPYKFFETGIGVLHSLAISGADKDLSYRVSVGLTDQKGIIPLSYFKKVNIGFSTDYKFSSIFDVSTSVNYVNSRTNRPQQGSNVNGVMLGLLRTPPTFDNSNGVTEPTDPKAYLLGDGSGRQRSYRGTGGYDNPYWTINMNPFTDNTNRVFGGITATLKPFTWLSIVERFGGDYYVTDTRQIYSKGSSGTNVAGAVFENSFGNRIMNNDVMATATKKFNNLNLSLMVGQNTFSTTFKSYTLQGYGLNFNEFQGISNTQSQALSISDSRLRRAAYYSRLSAAYNNYLFVDLTGRIEKSSTLPVAHNTYFYPSASLGFVFTDALHMDSKFLNFGKLRASYARVGKDLSPYSLQTYYVQAAPADGWTDGIVFPFNGLTGFLKSSLIGNPDLKAESTSSLELGTELHFFSNRLIVDYTYYSSKSKDLLNAVSVANSSGFGSVFLNAASMENKGHELTVTGTPLRTKSGFDWTIVANFSSYRNKVTKLGEGIDRLDFNGFSGIFVSALVGQPYGIIYGTGYVTDSKGNLVIMDQGTTGDGEYGLPIIANDLKYLGNTNPKWTGSISNNLSWKGFNLYFMFETRQKYDMWNGTWGAMTNFGTSKNTENRYTNTVFKGVEGHLDGNGNLVTSEKQNSISAPLNEDYYTGVGSGFAVNEPFVQDATWVRLREVTVGYTLDGGKLFKDSKKAWFNSATFSVSGRNLWLHTNYTGVDPETSLFGSQVAQGFDYFNNPGTRTYAVSLKLVF